MKIQVLGSGCPTCKRLYELTKKAVKQLNLQEDVEYITDISKIIEMGIMSSPVLAIDGKPAMVGFVSDIEKIKKLLTNTPVVQDFGSGKKSSCSCGGNC